MKRLYYQITIDHYRKWRHSVQIFFDIHKRHQPYHASEILRADNLEKDDLMYDAPYLKQGHILNIQAWMEAKRLDELGEFDA